MSPFSLLVYLPSPSIKLLPFCLEPVNDLTLKDGRIAAAEAHGLQLVLVKLAEAKRDFVLLSRRWA